MQESYISSITIPLLVAAATLYYAFRLLVLKDVYSVRGRKKGKVKNEEQYARDGGFLMLFLSVSSMAMAGLMYFSIHAALIEIAAAVIIYGVLWRKMEDKYGA